MEKTFAKLQRIGNNEAITGESHPEFLWQLQQALLLALREQGRLSPMEHRHAEEQLRQQRRHQARQRQEQP